MARGIDVELCQKSQHSFRRLMGLGLRRAFWAAMLALHVSPIVSAWQVLSVHEPFDAALAGGLRLSFLIASAAFFLLKLADVRWLRLKPGWRTTVHSLIVIGLLHAGALDRAAGTQTAYTPGHVGMVLFATGLLGAGNVPGLLSSLAKAGCRPTHTSTLQRHSALQLAFASPTASLIIVAAGPRAPPHS